MDTLENKVKESLLKRKECQQEKFLSQNLPAYDSNLINLFEHDHEELINLYNKILELAKNEKYSSVQLSIVEFASLFTDHINVEDQKLYNYLRILASEKSCLEQSIVADFSDEMNKIADFIYVFLTESPSIPVSKYNVDCFLEEFEEIGILLRERIIREEKILYPIYKNRQK